MELFTLLVVGLIAGLLASLFIGGVGYGILRDILTGMLGAMLGRWLFGPLGIPVPNSGSGGTIFVAFIGAAVLLLLLRVVRNARRTRDRWASVSAGTDRVLRGQSQRPGW